MIMIKPLNRIVSLICFTIWVLMKVPLGLLATLISAGADLIDYWTALLTKKNLQVDSRPFPGFTWKGTLKDSINYFSTIFDA